MLVFMVVEVVLNVFIKKDMLEVKVYVKFLVFVEMILNVVMIVFKRILIWVEVKLVFGDF